MCEILDRVENRGIQRGIEQERQRLHKEMEARDQELIRLRNEIEGHERDVLSLHKEMASDLRKEGWSDEKIASFLHVPVVDVRIWHGTLDS